ncbi:TetR/AcrR family transcriptional regulator [Plantactinospora siamensis]|uniref:TetR/AcrR family transcriptional regulator n=1 Tax=Plantactinospora siamensis TaxID=555372 RepID=A0ABV6NYM1_9ACTN
MPRVSEQHLAARRQQILDAARTCFLRDGFHNTSMQDVIAEAGLSMGAVYRYFRSKNELIASIAEATIGGAQVIFDELAAQRPTPTLIEALGRTLEYVDREASDDGVLRIAIQVWAEAQRDPALAEFVADKYATFRRRYAELARRARDSGELPPDTDPEQVGAALFGLVPGYFTQRLLTGEPDRHTYLAGVRSLLGARLQDPGR